MPLSQGSEENPAGFPRPVLKRNGKNTPVPWIGAYGPADGRWAMIDGDRNEKATAGKLCIICGQPRGDDYVYALFKGKPYDAGTTLIDRLFGTSDPKVGPAPTYGHPKCVLIAATFCPHLKRAKYPAQTQDGQPLTHDELRQLAHKT